MKTFENPELEVVLFISENIADVSMNGNEGTGDVEGGDF